MKLLLLLVLATFSCAVPLRKPTVGEQICQVACQRIDGDYHNMTEQPRNCYCVFQMPDYAAQERPATKQPGTVYAY